MENSIEKVHHFQIDFKLYLTDSHLLKINQGSTTLTGVFNGVGTVARNGLRTVI